MWDQSGIQEWIVDGLYELIYLVQGNDWPKIIINSHGWILNTLVIEDAWWNGQKGQGIWGWRGGIWEEGYGKEDGCGVREINRNRHPLRNISSNVQPSFIPSLSQKWNIQNRKHQVKITNYFDIGFINWNWRRNRID